MKRSIERNTSVHTPIRRGLTLAALTLTLAIGTAYAQANAPQWPIVGPTTQPQPTSPLPAAPANPQFPASPAPMPSNNPPVMQAPGMPNGATPVLMPTLESRARRFANRPSVTILEFRSNVQEVLPRAATDMFITALVETGKFKVLERARLAEGVLQERSLNQTGLVSGQSVHVKLAEAKYVFEGTVSEAQMNQNGTSAGLNILGLGAKHTSTRDTIGIDIRVIEVESGIVADAIKVRRQIKGSVIETGGVGDAITNMLSNRFLGGAVVATGGKEYENWQRESFDNALRLAIEEAVGKISERFADE